MEAAAVCAAILLHLGFEHVVSSAHQFAAQVVGEGPHHRPVDGVVLLDHLERPAALERIAADQLGLDALCLVLMTGLAQLVGRFADEGVGVAHHLVEVIEVAPRPLHPLEGLAELADG